MDRSRRPPDPPQQSSSEQRSPKPSRRGCSERVGDVEVERAAVSRGDSGPRHACPYRRGVPCGDHRRRPPAPADCVMLNQGLMSSLRSPRSTTSSREWRPMRARRRVSCAGRPRRRPAAGAPGEPRLARRHRRGRDGRRRLHDRAPRRQLARRLRRAPARRSWTRPLRRRLRAAGWLARGRCVRDGGAALLPDDAGAAAALRTPRRSVRRHRRGPPHGDGADRHALRALSRPSSSPASCSASSAAVAPSRCSRSHCAMATTSTPNT